MQMIDIGFKSLVSADKILAVIAPDSSPVKRMVQEAREKGKLIDATYGRKTESVLVLENDHVMLSSLEPEKIAERMAEK